MEKPTTQPAITVGGARTSKGVSHAKPQTSQVTDGILVSSGSGDGTVVIGDDLQPSKQTKKYSAAGLKKMQQKQVREANPSGKRANANYNLRSQGALKQPMGKERHGH
jgi:hypothetical protein